MSDAYQYSESGEYRRDYSTAERVALAKKGHAIPVRDAAGEIIDGRYPIADAADLANAIHAIGRANEPSEVKAYIKRRAAALDRSSDIPDSWRSEGMIGPEESDYEFRSYGRAELRSTQASGDGLLTLEGYAAVFDQEAVLADRAKWRTSEVIRRGAFADVLRQDPDVHLLYEHDPRKPLARSRVRSGAGALELREDHHGLHVWAKLDPEVSYVADLARQMRSGVVDQMSFGFKVKPSGKRVSTRTLPDGREDDLIELRNVSALLDTTVTVQGVYSQARAELRSLAPIIDRRTPRWVGGEILIDSTVSGEEKRSIAPSEGGNTTRRAMREADVIRILSGASRHRRSHDASEHPGPAGRGRGGGGRV